MEIAAALLPNVAARLDTFPILGSHGTANSSRAPFSCLITAAAFHRDDYFSQDNMVDFACAILVTFGVDDTIEGADGKNRDEELDAYCSRAAEVLESPVRFAMPISATSAESGLGVHVDQVLAALAHWLTKLPQKEADSIGRQSMAEQFMLMLHAMAKERSWARGGSWPTLEEYLATSLFSTANPFLWDVARVLSGTGREPDSISIFRTAVKYLATCCRLYNDMRTFEREAAEGEANAVSILDVAGIPEDDVYPRLLVIADLNYGKMREIIARFPGRSGVLASP